MTDPCRRPATWAETGAPPQRHVAAIGTSELSARPASPGSAIRSSATENEASRSARRTAQGTAKRARKLIARGGPSQSSYSVLKLGAGGRESRPHKNERIRRPNPSPTSGPCSLSSRARSSERHHPKRS